LSTKTDEFVQNAAAKVDILWVVDNSGSMDQEQTGLGESFSAFISALLTSGVDYHIGVISTDVDDGGHLHTGVGAPPFIDAFTSEPEDAFLKNVKVGITGSAQEKGFEAAALALGRGIGTWSPTDPEPVAVPNSAFLRRGYCINTTCEGTTDSCTGHDDCDRAALFLIFVSDEDDKSFGPVRYYWRLFESYFGPGNEPQIKISAIVGDPINPDNQEGGCFNAGRGSAQPGDRYIELVVQSGGTSEAAGSAQGIFTSICEEFNDSLTALSINAAGLSSKFRLSAMPNMNASIPCDPLDVQPMCVRVNGAAMPPDMAGGRNGWSYDPGDNAIVFGFNVVPPPQSKVTVQFQGSNL
jgi:hypothetical protein